MNYKILLLALPATILVLLTVSVALPRLQQDNQASTETKQNLLPSVTLSTPTPLPGSSSAFLPESSAPVNNPPPTYQGRPVKSLNDVAQIIASATSSAGILASASTSATATIKTASTSSLAVQLLALPNVPDSEINIDPSGVATALGYVKYFNGHFKDVSFDSGKFSGVLKNKNGTILFVPDLIQKALVDNNFAEIHDSLVVQRNFADADIAYMKSIKVAGAAIALNKQAIGLEELTQNLIDKALAVGAGTLSKNDFLGFYGELAATAQDAHQKLSVQVGLLTMAVGDNWLTDILDIFSTKAFAQSANPPFGGTVVSILPCECNLGEWVVIGTPVPALLFVPIPFLASPLFFPFKGNHPGAWWLGLYSPLDQILCLSAVASCGPIGSGGEIIMAGTSQ